MALELALHDWQRAIINKHRDSITFVHECQPGSTYYFELTYNQFMALNDSLYLFNRDGIAGHFPLGQTRWFFCSHDKAILYDCTIPTHYFKFKQFSYYKSCIHRELLSFFRRRGREAVTSRHRHYNDSKQDYSRGGRREGESKREFRNRKRSLSTALQSSNQSSTTKTSSQWETSPGSPNHAIDSHQEQAHSLFSERDNSTSRRRNDSFPIQGNIFNDLTPPEDVQLEANNIPNSLVSE